MSPCSSWPKMGGVEPTLKSLGRPCLKFSHRECIGAKKGEKLTKSDIRRVVGPGQVPIKKVLFF